MGDSYYYLLCAHGEGGYGVCTCYMQAQRRTPGLRLHYSLSCLLETGSLIEPENKLLASKTPVILLSLPTPIPQRTGTVVCAYLATPSFI